jgi:hypothetical protein
MLTAALMAGIGYILFSGSMATQPFSLFAWAYPMPLPPASSCTNGDRSSWFIRLRSRNDGGQRRRTGGRRDHRTRFGAGCNRVGLALGRFFAGTLFLVVGLPLCVGVRRSPESIGMAPDGEPLQAAQSRRPFKAPAGHDRRISPRASDAHGDFLAADSL